MSNNFQDYRSTNTNKYRNHANKLAPIWKRGDNWYRMHRYIERIPLTPKDMMMSPCLHLVLHSLQKLSSESKFDNQHHIDRGDNSLFLFVSMFKIRLMKHIDQTRNRRWSTQCVVSTQQLHDWKIHFTNLSIGDARVSNCLNYSGIMFRHSFYFAI